MQCLESKYREDLRERDRRIAELEKNAASESSKCLALESQLRDLKHKGDVDSENARSGTKQLESQLANARLQLSEARKQLSVKQDSFVGEREAFLDRLTNLNHHFSYATQQYAQLVSNTIPLSDHIELKRMYTTGQLSILRLERKLANAEDQIMELAHLNRQSNRSNDLLREHLRDALHQITVREDMLDISPSIPASTVAAHFDLQVALSAMCESTYHQDITTALLHLHELLVNYSITGSQQLFFAYTCVEKELVQTSKLAGKHSRELASALASHKTISASLESAERERSSFSEQFHTLTKAQTSLQRAYTSLKDQNDTLHSQQRQSVLIHEAAVKKDKNEIQRLTNIIQKSRVAEDALRVEIDRSVGSRSITNVCTM
jgi:chromosome segregation ATPase